MYICFRQNDSFKCYYDQIYIRLIYAVLNITMFESQNAV